MLWVAAALQSLLLLVLVRRLIGGWGRRPAERPLPEGVEGDLTVVVPTLDEGARLGPCLEGLLAQGAPVREILVVDSGSTDGTRELVRSAMARDARVRLVDDPPLPVGWIGKGWAHQHAAQVARGEWLLGMDADTRAVPGCAAAVLAAARREGFDAVSFAPRFAGQGRLERWLQPALLASLIYRTGVPGDPEVRGDRVLANGQCFLVRRAILLANGGYVPVRESFAEDVSLARHLARAGARVGFLDGSRLYAVEAYESAGQMWREWGRSLDLKDATTRARQWADTLFVVGAQGMPLPAAVAIALAWGALAAGPARAVLAAATAGLLAVRVGLSFPLRGSYAERGIAWWLSPLADPLAAVRLVVSSVRRPRAWRTRSYGR